MIFLTLALLDVVRVSNSAEFVAAAKSAKAGRTILLEPGEYKGGVYLENLRGRPGASIVIGASIPSKPPVFVGGGSGIQISKSSYLEISDITIRGARDNGLNIDDGGLLGEASEGICLENIKVYDLPAGNHDGIKLSGLAGFLVEKCTVERWGGSAIDMVGCRNGIVSDCTFKTGGSSGIQMKGGTRSVVVKWCRFEDCGERSLNIGGSTGLPYFRPPIETIAAGSRYEAKEIDVHHCTIIGSVSPIAFVGVDGANVRFNTIYRPGRWAIRILQETSTPDFVRCRNGVFESNLIAFQSDSWASGGVNIGGGTEPSSFRFARNFWYCEDQPSRSKPNLPTEELDGVYGKDPMFVDAAKGNVRVSISSIAKKYGAGAIPPQR